MSRRIGPRSAFLLVVASMTGSGAFTLSGFALADLGAPGRCCWPGRSAARSRPAGRSRTARSARDPKGTAFGLATIAAGALLYRPGRWAPE